MKKKRKEDLFFCFPQTPYYIMNQMEDKGAANFCVFLSEGRELFVRCYHRFSGGELIERQRYVFAKDGCVRYIFDEWGDNQSLKSKELTPGWRIATRFREPRFASMHYPWWLGFDNSYCILNADAYKHSDMRYCPLSEYRHYPMRYLQLYIHHPNIEYLEKTGYGFLITENNYRDSYYTTGEYIIVDEHVNLKSNNLLKMLDLNRTEFKLLQGRERDYLNYIHYRKLFPQYKAEELIAIAHVYERGYETAKKHAKLTGLPLTRIARYLSENNIPFNDYSDYLDQCRKLRYNLRDTAISMPHDFYEMHERCSELLEAEADPETQEAFRQHMAQREPFAFEWRDLFLRQPKDIKEISREGRLLHHCVGGYAERHAMGFTNIFFIRQKNAPDKPFYTMEVDNHFNIIQCRGYRNDLYRSKPPEVVEFETQYKKYLDHLKEIVYAKRNQRAARQGA